MREHWNSNFRVRPRADAVDSEVRSETGGTIAVSGYLGHSSLRQSKNYELLAKHSDHTRGIASNNHKEFCFMEGGIFMHNI